MTVLFNIIALITVVAIPALHILSLLLRSTVLSIASLVAHILALSPLLYFSAPLALVVMLYLLSLAIRCLAFTVINRIRHSGKETEK